MELFNGFEVSNFISRRHDSVRIVFAETFDLAKAESNGGAVGAPGVVRPPSHGERVLRVLARLGKVSASTLTPALSLPGRGSQRAIPLALIHIHASHFDSVLARVSHDLRRRVKTHRLTVQQRA